MFGIKAKRRAPRRKQSSNRLPRIRKPRLDALEPRQMLASLLPGFAQTQITGDLADATSMAFAPDGRLFITRQSGSIVGLTSTFQRLPTPALSLTVDSTGERGLLGLAFDPQFAQNQFIYVHYTVPGSPPHNRVSRFTMNGNVVVAGSENVLLELGSLGATNHNGGAIHFGADGKLYIAVGENNVPANSQTLSNLFGKMLRINKDGSIPTDNPFVNTPGARPEIWALGLRNPFTFGVQETTGRIFINDVGSNQFEEVNNGVAGGNYGWPSEEGPGPNPAFIDPIFSYGRGNTVNTGSTISGGDFYNPPTTTFPSQYVGDYFFAELGSRWIRSIDPTTNVATLFASDLTGLPVDVDIGPDGSLYYLSLGGSSGVYKIRALANNESVVRALYQDVFNRTPTDGEVNGWVNALNGGASLKSVAAQFVNSPEKHAALIQELYTTYLGRAADSGGLQHWISVAQGVNGYALVRMGIAGSSEAVSRAGSLSNYVQSLYTGLLGRTGSQNEVNGWVSVIQSSSAANVVNQFVTSAEHRTRLLSQYYTTYLDRALDTGGRDFWLGRFAAGASPEAVQAKILSSGEYVALNS